MVWTERALTVLGNNTILFLSFRIITHKELIGVNKGNDILMGHITKCLNLRSCVVYQFHWNRVFSQIFDCDKLFSIIGFIYLSLCTRPDISLILEHFIKLWLSNFIKKTPFDHRVWHLITSRPWSHYINTY